MAREEYIRLYRSNVSGATPALTSGEIATNLIDRRLFVGGTNGSLITFNDASSSVTGISAGHTGISINKTTGNVVIHNMGVLTVNGQTGHVSISVGQTVTGDGGALIGVNNSLITAKLATTGASGVASFRDSNFAVSGTGAVSIKTGGVPNAALVNSSVTVSAGTGLGGGGSVALGSTVTLTNLGVVSLNGLTGATTLTGDGGAVRGIANNVIGARIASCQSGSQGISGVIAFDCSQFVINSGVVSLAAPPPPTGCAGECPNGCDFSCNGLNQTQCGDPAYGSELCEWCTEENRCVCMQAAFCPNGIVGGSYTGLGASAAADGSISYLYLDVNNLNSFTGSFASKTDNYVVFFDANETGIMKTKKASLKTFFLNNLDTLLESKTTSQFSRIKGGDSIEFRAVLGNIQAGEEGLIKGASAHDYITKNTVASVDGCTGPIEITGTVNEVTVTTSCPTITVGLPDHIVLASLSATGATFTGSVRINDLIVTQDITATHFQGSLLGRVTTPCKNTESYTLTAGTPVYISGYVGGGGSGIIEVKAAAANNSSTMPAVGLLEDTLLPNGEGHLVEIGLLGSLDTNNFVSGQTVFISPSGGLTSTRPTSGSHLVQNIGRVVNTSTNQGQIIVLGPGRTNDVPNNIIVRGTLEMPNGQTATSLVSSLNGLSGAITITGDGGSQFIFVSGSTTTITNRLATTGATGVASFNSSDFTVVSGAVGLTGTIARTDSAQTFTALQTFSNGISGSLTGGAARFPITTDNTSNAQRFILFANGAGYTSINIDSSSPRITYNPSTGALRSSLIEVGQTSPGLTITDQGVFACDSGYQFSKMNGDPSPGPISFLSESDIFFGDPYSVSTGTNMGMSVYNGHLFFGTANQLGNFAMNRSNAGLTFAIEANHAQGRNLRLVYNDTASISPTGSVDFTTNSSGNLTIRPNGGTVSVIGGISADSHILSPSGIIALTGSFTITGSHNGKVITVNSGVGCTATIPVGLPVGHSVTVIQLGTGQVGFTASSGVTMNSFSNLIRIGGQHGSASLVSYEGDIFNLAGNLA